MAELPGTLAERQAAERAKMQEAVDHLDILDQQGHSAGSLPAMRAELQAQFSATSDPMQRALLQSALVSIEGAKESAVKTVGSISGSGRAPMFKVGDKVFNEGVDTNHTIVELRGDDGTSYAYAVSSDPPLFGGGNLLLHEDCLVLQSEACKGCLCRPIRCECEEVEMKAIDVQKVEPSPKEKKYPYRHLVSDEYAVDPVRLRELAVELGSVNGPTRETVDEYMRRAEAENKPPPKANQGFRLRINLKDYTREQAVALAVKINKIDNLDLDVEVTRGEWDDSDDDDDVDEILPEPQQDPSADSGAMSQLE